MADGITLSRSTFDGHQHASAYARGAVYPAYRPRPRPMFTVGNNRGWNGIVIFKSLSGQQATATGTPTAFILIHKSDSVKGTVEYCDGTNEQSWLPGTECWKISNLPSGAYPCE